MAVFSDLFIGGQWVAGSDRVPVIDPSDGSVITTVATAGERECDEAVAAADAAAGAWARTSPRERAEILRRAFELMRAEADDIAELITRENGKVLADARGEATYAAEFFRWFSEEAVRVPGDFRPAPNGDKRILVTHYPVGVSLLITPWNFPAAMATRKIAPALAAGCTVVLKPATETPLTALAIADLLKRAGVPDGVVNVVLPKPTGALVSRMLHDPRVRNLSFTGSTEVGRVLLHEAADLIIRTSMELGGNAPFLVLADADVEKAVEGAMAAKMRNGGSACTAANRFYVAREVAKEFTERFAAAMGALRLGPGLDPSSQLGALVSTGERDKVAELVDMAIGDGAKPVVGGAVPDRAGAYYPATVLTDVAADAPILDREIFGPVAPIVVVDSDEEAIAHANATEYGLISYVYSGELGRAIRAAEAIESGMVAVNRGVISDPAAPFGGVKQSGLGREGGFDGIHEFLETKYIGLDI
ncbi:NAD-dependent succinate-semialdehyde dehydrogenase [Planosporangium flavigriseum]|uniref:NAD-dependent succinate-semialdehyde dehydrogenase n=1 Tax=Planosporangium flavigriseum TaxID=373681 RepID=A0A8J3PP37_9ACTN|nr:NAD-dependent succinate-semialdehyde dehydrogenase [Planosporangium flavigriseum]NJC67717.1 NAD-dependent succinate-semialdehyde dehydrogenase [Planosporangium flavigriseum]GIG75994.1 NAD-dependent succinate-semialdehyde dehydrogenase [Planosporangium flavigriseum]